MTYLPQTIIDSEGNQVEVFTPEEVQAKVEEQKKQVEGAQEELRKLKEKDLNFEKLRMNKKVAEGEITREELQQKIQEEFAKGMGEKLSYAREEIKKEVVEGVNKDYYNEIVGSLSGDDEELKKKINFEYNRLKDPVNSKEDISKKLRDAYVLASRVEDAGAFVPGTVSSGGASKPKFKQQGAFSADEIAFAKKLAASGGIKLTDEDLK